MIIFGIIGSVCAGFLGAVVIGAILGFPEWAVWILAVLIACGMEFGLMKCEEKEKKEIWEQQKWVTGLYKDVLKARDATIAAAVHDLKEVDLDCRFCRNAFEETGVNLEECLQQTNCEKCTLDCLCRGCDGKSHYQWRGLCEENGGEEA